MEDLPKAYSPKEVEDKWYSFWEKSGFFTADAYSEKEPFCVVMPPPNVTGVLHMGHALVSTLQDAMVRYKRMRDFESLWIPGTDHAGISTQTVVEKHLIATLGKRRKDFTREEFLSHIWKWKEDKQNRILEQIKKLGCSCDWDRLSFTMDQTRTNAVLHMFKKMFDEGYIYRGDYLVNWDPVTQTALADDEVEHEERDSHLWYFKYPIIGSDDYAIVATTRPETMLGDTAIAVSTKDPRFTKLIGRKVLLPLVGREIPIIADNFVDPKFGTGMVKITPAHDFNDYVIGQKHNLPMVNIMSDDGKINKNGTEQFLGLTMLEARKAVVKEMEKQGLLEKIEPYKLRVGVSYRSKAIIEPHLSKQWFVKMTAFKDKLIDAVKSKKVTIIPSYWEDTYFYWIENLRDWCISRQIWWGHRIPIWYHKEDSTKIICHIEEGLPPQVQKEPEMWYQDEDVLDTWFSSALWPFSVMGWPEKTKDFEKFFPTSLLVTGHDILFFWVARMILMSEYATGEPPFHQTFIHGLIYGKSYWRTSEDGSATYVDLQEKIKFDMGDTIPSDVSSRWEKMSKSKGNIIDPLEIIDAYGTDAMRMALASSATHARQIDLDRRKFYEFKNFANKIWNGSRFILQNLEKEPALTKEEFAKGIDFDLFTLEDKWILSKVNRTIVNMNQNFENYHFDRAANEGYDFFWNDFCSNYLEMVKPALFGKAFTPEIRINKMKLLVIVLGDIIRLLHPIAPFITEEVFSYLQNYFKGAVADEKADDYTKKTLLAFSSLSCMKASYPQLLSEKDLMDDIEKDMESVLQIIYTIRNIRAEMQIPLNQKTDIYLFSEKKAANALLAQNLHILPALTKTANITFCKSKDQLPKGSTSLLESVHLVMTMPEDLMKKEKARLEKEKGKLLLQKEQLKKKLSVKEFLEKAPDEVVKKMKNSLLDIEKKLKEIEKKCGP